MLFPLENISNVRRSRNVSFELKKPDNYKEYFGKFRFALDMEIDKQERVFKSMLALVREEQKKAEQANKEEKKKNAPIQSAWDFRDVIGNKMEKLLRELNSYYFQTMYKYIELMPKEKKTARFEKAIKLLTDARQQAIWNYDDIYEMVKHYVSWWEWWKDREAFVLSRLKDLRKMSKEIDRFKDSLHPTI